jgi:hypothetical protein
LADPLKRPFLDACIESRYFVFLVYPTRADQVSLRLFSDAGRDDFLPGCNVPRVMRPSLSWLHLAILDV